MWKNYFQSKFKGLPTENLLNKADFSMPGGILRKQIGLVANQSYFAGKQPSKVETQSNQPKPI